MKDSYRIDVKDFGPIARASVDFRPLTVFIGPSNTGKSYLAVLLYALHRCLSGWDPEYYRLGIYRSFGNRRMESPVSNFSKFDLREFIENLKDWYTSISPKEPLPALPDSMAEAIHSVMGKTDRLRVDLTNEIRRYFGVDGLGELIRRKSSGKRGIISLCVPQKSGSSTLGYDLEFNSRKAHLSPNIPSKESLSSEMDLPKQLSQYLRQYDSKTTDDPDMINLGFDPGFWEFLSGLFHSLIGPAGWRAFYLPADRTGVMHSHQVVVSALVQNASTAGLQPAATVPMLSGVLADFLTLLIGIGPEGYSRPAPGLRGRSPELGRGLEDNLLNGTVLLKSTDAGYPAFAYRPDGWRDDLPLMRASSMVSELAPVVLYLRHIVRPGDVLIIEEPEAHLHPAMQAAFARELARLVRAGVRIVMTTHSEWFLEQIGNLVRLSGLSKARRQGLESADCALSPDQVGAWLFRPSNRPKGSVVEEVALDPETGLYPTGYDAVSDALYNEGANIYNRIQESKQK